MKVFLLAFSKKREYPALSYIRILASSVELNNKICSIVNEKENYRDVKAP
jgi:hypothetical protein